MACGTANWPPRAGRDDRRAVRANQAVVVGTPDNARLGELAKVEGWQVRRDGHDRLVIHGASATEVGRAAAREGIVLSELLTEPSTRQLEELFLQLTGTEVRP